MEELYCLSVTVTDGEPDMVFDTTAVQSFVVRHIIIEPYFPPEIGKICREIDTKRGVFIGIVRYFMPLETPYTFILRNIGHWREACDRGWRRVFSALGIFNSIFGYIDIKI